MAKKDFTYRGKSTDELLKLNVREFAQLLPSMRKRRLLRGFGEIEKFIKRCQDKLIKKKRIRTHQRDLIIVPKMVGWNIHVHTGKEYVQIAVVWDMIGHYLGEFALTRKKVAHSSSGAVAKKASSRASLK